MSSRVNTRTFFGQDYDDLFAYSTVKIARIRDRRLGILHYAFMAGIIAYIIGYSVIYQQHYLETEVPFGTVRATLQEPPIFKPANQLPYCTQNQTGTYTSEDGAFHKNYQCVYLHGFDVQYEAGARNQLFATTRIKDTIYLPPGNCTDVAVDPGCFSTANLTTRYYIADIESFTVYMEHEVYGQQTGATAKNGDLWGKVYFPNGTRVDFAPPRAADVVPLGDIMQWANLNSLEARSGAGNLTNTLRYDGATIVIVVSYQNRQNTKTASDLKYTYSAHYIAGLDVVAQEPSFVNNISQRVQRSRHGVALLFLIAGSVGKFTFAALLTALVSGFVLLGVSTTIVDLMLQYVLPERVQYKALKFDISNDFSATREAAQLEAAKSDL